MQLTAAKESGYCLPRIKESWQWEGYSRWLGIEGKLPVEIFVCVKIPNIQNRQKCIKYLDIKKWLKFYPHWVIQVFHTKNMKKGGKNYDFQKFSTLST